MAIKEHNQNGKKFFSVYVCITSEKIPTLRVQKRKTNIPNRNQAQNAERNLIKACLEIIAKKENEGYSWGAIVDRWFHYELYSEFSEIGPLTLQDYLSAMKKWTVAFWNKPAHQITRADIRNLISKMEEDGRSKSFQAKVKQTVNKIFNWGMEEGHITGVFQSPTVGIKVNRKAEKVPEILSLQEVRKFLDAAKALEHEWYPIWAFAVLTGCRNGELYALSWDDVNLEKNFIRVSKSYNTRLRMVKSTKAGYWRNIPINSDLKALLVELKSNARGRKEVLPRFRDWEKGNQAKVLRTFLQSIGLPSVKFHTLRACFATILLQDNVAPATVMKICGWKDLDTMARYIRLAAIDENGATDGLRVLPLNQVTDNVVNLLQSTHAN